MTYKFVQGATNHINWKMVDATDFATPESALSAAMKIKIYGQLNTAAGTNFVSSGTGSLTNDITHVGPSATGVYHIALASADLSDASAAFYDHYIIHLSATGAAWQTVYAEGTRTDTSYISAVLSDILSAAVQINSRVLLAESFASDAASAAAQGNSRVLLVQSRLSELNSAYSSDMSDVRSMLTALSGLTSDAHSAAAQGNSRVLLVQSMVSDFRSVYASDISNVYSMLSDTLSTMNSQYSDLKSAIGNVSVAITASDISDIASAVAAATGSTLSDIQSYLAAMSGMLSDAHSAAILGASHASNAASGVTVLLSRVTSVTATASDLVSKIWSDFESKMGATPSQLYSVLVLAGSRVSDVQSYLVGMSGMLSDTHSAATAAAGAASTSAIAAKVWSDFGSKVGATPSQLYSVALIGASAASDAASAAAQANSRILLVQSRLSDFQSVYASDMSDVRSMLTAISGLASDAHSAAILAASHASDAHSAALLAASAASDAHSATLLAQSMISDVDSALTSQYSDLKSAVGAVSVAISASDLSDLASQVVEAVSSAVLDVNVVQVRGHSVIGSGIDGDAWRPA